MLAADGCASGWDNRRATSPPSGFPGAVGEWRWRWFDIGQLTDVQVAQLNTRICRNECLVLNVCLYAY
jgi:hypothetical protein